MFHHKPQPLDHVVTVTEGDPLSAAAEAMQQESVGSVVVTSETGDPVGIVTDRDIALRAVARNSGAETLVKEVMTQPLETMDADSSRSELIARMRALGIRRIPLARDGELIGVASLDDLSFELAADLNQLTQAVATKLGRSRRHARLDAISREAEEALRDVRHRLRYVNWMTRQRFLDELDELRAKVAKTIHGSSDTPSDS